MCPATDPGSTLAKEWISYPNLKGNGGCDEGIEFLNYDFLHDEKNEYLVLTVTEPLRLPAAKDDSKCAVLTPGSVLIFTIQRTAVRK